MCTRADRTSRAPLALIAAATVHMLNVHTYTQTTTQDFERRYGLKLSPKAKAEQEQNDDEQQYEDA
jgi:hypothetical protein